jgi:hypothetical protein
VAGGATGTGTLGEDAEGDGFAPEVSARPAVGEVAAGLLSPMPDLFGAEEGCAVELSERRGLAVGPAGTGSDLGLGFTIPGGAASSTGAPQVSQNSPSRCNGLLQKRQTTPLPEPDARRGNSGSRRPSSAGGSGATRTVSADAEDVRLRAATELALSFELRGVGGSRAGLMGAGFSVGWPGSDGPSIAFLGERSAIVREAPH